ncbi:hypothetical protein Cthiooxydans_22680 [Comamonas thiooxydans]|nr:hypothetical protein Cthiooxydans_22680 [Comamonas thiooxydans]
MHQRDGDDLADHGNPAQLNQQLHVLPLGQALYAKQGIGNLAHRAIVTEQACHGRLWGYAFLM